MTEFNVLEFLKDFNVEIPENISKGSLFRITYTSDYRTFCFYLKFEELIDAESTMKFERNMCKCLSAENVSIVCRYPSELFTLEYFETLKWKLKRKINSLRIISRFITYRC